MFVRTVHILAFLICLDQRTTLKFSLKVFVLVQFDPGMVHERIWKKGEGLLVSAHVSDWPSMNKNKLILMILFSREV